MENWRTLTNDERELLTSYYKLNSNLPYIFFNLPKIFGAVYALSGVWEALTNITTAPVARTMYILLSSISAFLLFCWVSNRLLRMIKLEKQALEDNTAQICSVIALGKDKILSHSHGKHHRRYCEYIVKADVYINGEKVFCNISTDSGSFANINIGEICNIVYFPISADKPMSEMNMTAFDFDFKYAKRMINVYGRNSNN